ncbi:3-phosphoinositide-dependent protein kinase, partial [Thraustotheca clavata]
LITFEVKESVEKPKATDFTLERELGQGNFSKVFLATHNSTKEQFAIKVIEKQRIMRLKIRHPNIFNEVNMEKHVLNRLRHPNIIRLYHTYQDATNLYFLMEYTAGGELWDALTLCGKQIGCTELLAKFYAADIVNALEYLASQRIVHRDLKPENMIVSKQDGHLRIVDFGTAKNLEDTTLNGPNFVGTPEYMSPETIDNKPVDTTVDLWALGCIIHQLLTGDTPFQGGSPYLCFLKVQAGTFDLPGFLSQEAKDIIVKLLKPNPAERLGADSFQALKDHPFFMGIDFDRHMQTSPPHPTTEDKFIIESAKQIFGYVWETNNDGPQPQVLVQAMALSHPRKPRLMHVLNRMQILQHPSIYPCFFPTKAIGRCQYASNRLYVGWTHGVQNEWKAPFDFVHVSGPDLGKSAAFKERDGLGGSSWSSELEQFQEMLRSINARDRIPAFVALSGNMTFATPSQRYYTAQLSAFHDSLSILDDKIRLVFVPGDHAMTQPNEYKQDFGDDYYCLWRGGVKCIIVNSSLWLHGLRANDSTLMERYLAQEAWLKKELDHGALCAQVLCIMSHHPLFLHDVNEDTQWIETQDDNNAPTRPWNIPKEARLPLLESFGEAKIHAIFSTNFNRSVHEHFQRHSKKPKHDNDDEDDAPSNDMCDMVVTASFSEKLMYNYIHVKQTGLTIKPIVIEPTPTSSS